MSEEVTIMPEPRGDEPPYAQKAIQEVREQQLLRCQETKGIAIDVIKSTMQWAADVASGKEQVEQYTAKGEPYIVDGKKYLFENANQLKGLVASVETIEGKYQENKNVLHVAILQRGSQKPVKSAEADVISVEVVEE